MDIIQLLSKELEQEAQTTRKMLQRVPEDKWDWKPHEKSMSLKVLSLHVAELAGWISMAINTEELDFAASPYTQPPVQTNAELLQVFETALQQGKDALAKATEADLQPNWTLRTGEHIHVVLTKYEMVRHALAQMIHHRAQLGVYLRLLNIPIPGSYGPSADEMNF